MKTKRSLVIASVFSGIFCLCCIAAIACFFIWHHFDIKALYEAGYGFVYSIGLTGPLALISYIFYVIFYCIEQKNPAIYPTLGKRWIGLWLLPAVDCCCLMCFVIDFASRIGGV